MDAEARHDFADKFQHECINDQNEKTESDKNQRKAQKKENRTNKRVNDAEQKGGPQKAANSTVIDSNDRRGYKNRKSRRQPSKDKVSHGLTLFELPLSAKPSLKITCQSFRHPYCDKQGN